MLTDPTIKRSTLREFLTRCHYSGRPAPRFVLLDSQTWDFCDPIVQDSRLGIEQILEHQNFWQIGLLPATVNAVVLQTGDDAPPIETMVGDSLSMFSAFTAPAGPQNWRTQGWIISRDAHKVDRRMVKFRGQTAGHLIGGSFPVPVDEFVLAKLVNSENFWTETGSRTDLVKIAALRALDCEFLEFLERGGGTGLGLGSEAIELLTRVYDTGKIKQLSSQEADHGRFEYPDLDGTLLDGFAHMLD